jgi:hypothetical protein
VTENHELGKYALFRRPVLPSGGESRGCEVLAHSGARSFTPHLGRDDPANSRCTSAWLRRKSLPCLGDPVGCRGLRPIEVGRAVGHIGIAFTLLTSWASGHHPQSIPTGPYHQVHQMARRATCQLPRCGRTRCGYEGEEEGCNSKMESYRRKSRGSSWRRASQGSERLVGLHPFAYDR